MGRCKERHKAWIGAAIGAASMIGSALIGNATASKNQKQAQLLQNKQDTLAMAENITSGYADQSYERDVQNRISTLKLGGRRRKRCALGTEDINAIINSIGTLGSSAITANRVNGNIKSNNMFANTPKTELKPTDYADNLEMIQLMKCGGRKRIKR